MPAAEGAWLFWWPWLLAEAGLPGGILRRGPGSSGQRTAEDALAVPRCHLGRLLPGAE